MKQPDEVRVPDAATPRLSLTDNPRATLDFVEDILYERETIYMNDTRRRRISRCIKEAQVIADSIAALQARVSALQNEVEDIKSIEEDAVANTPDSLQDTDRYALSEEACEHLQEACDALEEVISSLDSAGA